MDYNKKHKEDLESAKGWFAIAKENNNKQAIQILENLFPELRESEDDRIRKEIIETIRCIKEGRFPTAVQIKKSSSWIAWLEKQAEQKPTDKVEPKFKVGDWIVNNDSGVSQHIKEIVNVNDETLYVFDEDKVLDVNFQEQYHLWTIQDANDGDVLATKKGNPFIYDKNRYNNGLAYYYAGLDVNKELTLKSPHHMLAHFGELCSIFPATREQRDLLFSKMHEAGYEWNAEKKELKKVEQNPAWSEEDDKFIKELCNLLASISKNEYVGKYYVPDLVNKLQSFKTKTNTRQELSDEDKVWIDRACMLLDELNHLNTLTLAKIPHNVDEIISHIKSIKDRVQPQPKQEWSEEDEKYWSIVIAEFSKCSGRSVSKDEWMRCNDWLNSLRNRVQLQPKQEWSEEDEKMLDEAIKHVRNYQQIVNPANEIGESDLTIWLQSLKPNHWKPSEEQLRAIINSAQGLYQCKEKGVLLDLYEQLKNL